MYIPKLYTECPAGIKNEGRSNVVVFFYIYIFFLATMVSALLRFIYSSYVIIIITVRDNCKKRRVEQGVFCGKTYRRTRLQVDYRGIHKSRT